MITYTVARQGIPPAISYLLAPPRPPDPPPEPPEPPVKFFYHTRFAPEPTPEPTPAPIPIPPPPPEPPPQVRWPVWVMPTPAALPEILPVPPPDQPLSIWQRIANFFLGPE